MTKRTRFVLAVSSRLTELTLSLPLFLLPQAARLHGTSVERVAHDESKAERLEGAQRERGRNRKPSALALPVLRPGGSLRSPSSHCGVWRLSNIALCRRHCRGSRETGDALPTHSNAPVSFHLSLSFLRDSGRDWFAVCWGNLCMVLRRGVRRKRFQSDRIQLLIHP